MRDRAAHGALIACLEMADERHRRRQQRKLRLEARPGQQAVLRHRRPDLDLTADFADFGEFGDAGDIDQHRGLEQPQIEHGQQRLTAGEHASIVAMLGQNFGRLVHRIGAHVIEGMRFHAPPPTSERSQPTSRCHAELRGAAASGFNCRASRSKNCRMMIAAAPSSRRPPTETTLPVAVTA